MDLRRFLPTVEMTTIPNLACFASLARVNPRVREFQITGNFAQAAQIVNYSSTKYSKVSDDSISELRVLRAFVEKYPFPMYSRIGRDIGDFSGWANSFGCGSSGD